MKINFNYRNRSTALSRIICLLLSMLLLVSAAGCGGGGGDEQHTEAPTTSENGATCEADTSAGADTSGTEALTETAPETEAETDAPVLLVKSMDLTDENTTPDTFVKASQAQTKVCQDGLLVTAQGQKARLTIDYAGYAASVGGLGMDADNVQYVICTLIAGSDVCVRLHSVTAGSGRAVTIDEAVTVTAGEQQTYAFNLRAANLTGALKTIEFDFGENGPKDASVVLGALTLAADSDEMTTLMGHPEYVLGYGSSLVCEDKDPIRHDVQTAPDEDASVSLWFDHTTEKVLQTNTSGTDRQGYTVYMAKNEAEGCQFILSPAGDRTFRIEVDPIVNSAGDTLSYELMYERYFKIDRSMTPDPLPPLTGPITVKGGKSQAFLLQVTTTPDTGAGDYGTLIHVIDDETGKEVKRAKVAVHVWDVTLSEETRLRTAFAINPANLYYAWGDKANAGIVLINTYEMLLRYRINGTDMPYDVQYLEYAAPYLDNPRVNTFRTNNYNVNQILSDHPEWLKKAIFYVVDEPDSDAKLQMLFSTALQIGAVYPQFRMVCPFYCNYDLNENNTICTSGEPAWDQLCFMAHSVNLWCCKLDAFTPRAFTNLSSTAFIETIEQENRHGTFKDRMKEEVDGGDELWAYVCNTPRQPYANWQIDSDGTETILSMWQCRQQDVTGMLYWQVNCWNVNESKSDAMADPKYALWWGDGMLVWDGDEYGLDCPIPSLRLVGIRDGIEDYQMLCMLEELVGREKVDELISLVSTSIVTYTHDDDRLHAARVLLGEMLEEVAKKN